LIQDDRSIPPPSGRAAVAQEASPPNQQLHPDSEAVNAGVLATWSEQLRLPTGRTLVAGVIELFGGALMMVGLLTSSVAFVASGLMACAYFLVHAPQGFYPLFNRGEPAVLFCFIWLFMATRSPGRFALDNMLSKSRRHGDPKFSRLSRAS
jgi:uncharacterized membrane protein YphA (DoxX/SURF4 family)